MRSDRLGELVRQLGPGFLGLAAAAAVALYLTSPDVEAPGLRPAVTARSPPKAVGPSLYCEFYDVASRIPKVGFTFSAVGTPPAYTLIDQRETDGSRTAFGGEAGLGPVWAFDGSNAPATLTSPDGSIAINLYAYRPKAGTMWFEAGLRSVRYRNLDGKCRTSAA